jgi:integrase/recombinase XerD
MNVTRLIPEYLKQMQARGFSSHSVLNAKGVLRHFTAFLHQEGVTDLEQLMLDVLEEYQQEIAFDFTATGKPLAIRTQAKRLSTIRSFTRFLKEHDYLVHDPGAKLKLPKEPKTLPRAILNEPDVKRLINAPDIHTNRGYRNRVILELLYDTGIRRAELADIKLADFDLDAGLLLVRGKGNKERVVPASSRICGLVRNYILSVRPSFLKDKDAGYLFLNRWGNRMGGNAIWAVVKRYVSLANVNPRVTTHSLRHTCATHMLKNGAPIRHIQEMLGHESLETTQIYTHVTISDLKAAHTKYHPSGRLEGGS